MQSPSKPALSVRSQATENEYRTTKKYLRNWGYKIGSFADYLLEIANISHATKLKHLRQARTHAKETNKKWNLGTLPPLPDKAPPIFSDEDFQNLYKAFENVAYPKFILPEFRSLYWQTIIHLASVTAMRRDFLPERITRSRLLLKRHSRGNYLTRSSRFHHQDQRYVQSHKFLPAGRFFPPAGTSSKFPPAGT